jgi:ATP-dependent DNA helicase RecQ
MMMTGMETKIKTILNTYWGYETFRPLQWEAMESVIQGRDSIVVLPTGGGKSLCYQVPAMVLDGMAIVLSPLISLMKDQVDALVDCGIPAARLNSGLTQKERCEVISQINSGSLKLLYVSPERVFSNGFIEYMQNFNISFIAIDEAHCISMWGHDFRPEYRMIGELKKKFDNIPMHAYTATATAQVRSDIKKQMQLTKPTILVGSFDRPNLVYKIERRNKILNQICEVLDNHKNESGIIYCIRRLDVEELCGHLTEQGYKALPYHAGLSDKIRKDNQDAFLKEKADIIVATIAFGMGIDKSNVRYVIHAALPKSLEHYQQESGRAGRDSLEAECCLFYSGEDYGLWQSIIRNGESKKAIEVALKKLNDLFDFCTGVECRHKKILAYFGEAYPKDNCNACDVCIGEMDTHKDALVTSQKILCCVKRLDERFGADYTATVLIGSNEARIHTNGHTTLSTYGLLKDYSKRIVRDWIEQLASQGYLEKSGEYNVLQVTEKGWQVIQGNGNPILLKPVDKKTKIKKKKSQKKKSWAGVDDQLFERLRELRKEIASRKNVPSFIIFGDESLRDMARRKPRTPEEFLEVHGVGEKKCRIYAPDFLAEIHDFTRKKED